MQKSLFASAAVAATLLAAPLASAADLTLYSGRGESMVEPIIAQFEKNTGISVAVRYGDTAQLAVLLQEEGSRSPADLYWGQDAGALGELSKAGLLAELPADIYEGLPTIYTSESGNWVAASGRARSSPTPRSGSARRSSRRASSSWSMNASRAVSAGRPPTAPSSPSSPPCAWSTVTSAPWSGSRA